MTGDSHRDGAADAPREGEAPYRAAYEYAPVGICVLDRDGNILHGNGRLYRMLGYGPGELEGQSFRRLTHPDDLGRELLLMDRLHSGELESVALEKRCLRKDGGYARVRATFSPAGRPGAPDTRLVAVVEEFAEEKVQALRESEELNRAILNTVMDGIITINSDATVVSFNPAAEKIFGYDRSEVIGQNVDMLMPEPYHSEHNTYINNYMTTGAKKIIGIGREVEGRRKDGSVFPLSLAVTEMKLDGRKMFTGILRDITEKKDLERHRADFLAMITHDFKSPLTSILGYAELIAALDREGQAAEMAGAILRGAEKLRDLVEDFLVHSKLDSGTLAAEHSHADADDILQEIKREFEAQASIKGLAIEVMPATGVGTLFVDRKLVQRALSNLVLNALNYTPEGGRITVKAEGRSGGAYVVFSVTDTGIGIPEGERGKIFEKYYRSSRKSNVKGTGLGLAIVKAVAGAHGGRVELESEVGAGSTFRMVLPAGMRGSEAA